MAFDECQWLGPYRLELDALDAEKMLDVTFEPELDFDSIEWQDISGNENYRLDFHELSGEEEPSVSYVSGSIFCDEAERVLFALRVNYFAEIWLNGQLLERIGSNHGSPLNFYYIPAQLNAGQNGLIIKLAAGSGGYFVELSMLRSRELTQTTDTMEHF